MIHPPEQTKREVQKELQREQPHHRLVTYDTDLALYEEQIRYQEYMRPPVQSNRRRNILVALLGGLALILALVVGIDYFYRQLENNNVLAAMQNQINAANLAIERDDYEAATLIYQQLVAANPQDPSAMLALTELGKELDSHISSQAAVTDEISTEEISDATDEQLNAILVEANLAFENQNWIQAIPLYEQIHTSNNDFQHELINSRLLDSYANSANQMLSSRPSAGSSAGGDLNLAIDYFNKALALDPNNATLRANKDYLTKYLDAERFLQDNAPQQALSILLPLRQTQDLDQAAEINRLLYRSYLLLGDQAIRSKKVEEGEQYYARAGELDVADTSKLQQRLGSLPLLTGNPATPTPPPVAVAAPSVPQEEPVVSEPPPESPTAPAVQSTSAAGCPDGRATITSPGNNAVLNGVVDIMGTAQNSKFKFYKLEYAKASVMEFVYYSGAETPISEWVLGSFDTTILPNGDYVLRLVVVDETGNYPPPCLVRVKIANGTIDASTALSTTPAITATSNISAVTDGP